MSDNSSCSYCYLLTLPDVKWILSYLYLILTNQKRNKRENLKKWSSEHLSFGFAAQIVSNAYKAPMKNHYHTTETKKVRRDIMTSLRRSALLSAGPVWGEYTGRRWILLTNASYARLLRITCHKYVWHHTNDMFCCNYFSSSISHVYRQRKYAYYGVCTVREGGDYLYRDLSLNDLGPLSSPLATLATHQTKSVLLPHYIGRDLPICIQYTHTVGVIRDWKWLGRSRYPWQSEIHDRTETCVTGVWYRGISDEYTG